MAASSEGPWEWLANHNSSETKGVVNQTAIPLAVPWVVIRTAMVYDCPGETVICVSGETEERRVQII
jgi:hypothetical protein